MSDAENQGRKMGHPPAVKGLREAWNIAHDVADACDGERKLGALSVAGKIHDAIRMYGATVDEPAEEVRRG